MARIITVGRQFGSGGRELGRRLAEALGIQYYDREIITEIAKKTSLSEEHVHNIIERKPMGLYPITIGKSFAYVGEYSLIQQQSVYKAQDKIIKELADRSDCVIVGRCADYILRANDPFRIFVYAGLESRIKRCQSRAESGEYMSEKEIKRQIKEIDKHRSKFYEFYTGGKWGDKANYDLLINTTNANIKETVAGVARMLQTV